MPSTKTPRKPSEKKYEYKPPKAEMRATVENPVLGAVSSGLDTLRGWLDKAGDAAFLPRPQGIAGIGHGMMGSSPEEIGEWARGSSPFSEEPNYGNRLDPRIKPGREQGVIDTAMLGADAAGLGLAGLRRGVRAAYPTVNPAMDMSRREFMGNTGKIAAGAAAASVVPAALRGAEHTAPRVVEHTAPAAARHVAAAVTRATPHEFFNAVNTADRIAKAHYEAALSQVYDRELAKAVKEGRIDRSAGHETPYANNEEVLDEINNTARGEALNKSVEVRDRLIKQIKDDPKYAGHETIEDALDRVPEGGDYHAAVLEWKKKHGVLEEPAIKARLESGGRYVDPQSGHEAFLNKHGEVEWRNVETGATSRHSHWLQDASPNPNHFPEEHGIFKNKKDPSRDRLDIYEKHMKLTPAESMGVKKKAAHENMQKAFNDAQKYDYLHDFTVEEMAELRRHLNQDEFKHGGSVTMPNNYRSGGRVRII